MTYKLWDKQSPIYNITAEQAMKNNPLYATEDSYLFLREDGSIYDILPISYLPEGDTPEARCEAFIAALTAPEPAPTPEPSDGITAEKALEILLSED